MKQVFLLAIVSSLLFTSCREMFGERIRGNGDLSSETRSVGSFDGVDVSGAIDIYARYDSSESVRVETDANLLPYIEVRNQGGILHIHEAEGVNLHSTRGIKVYVASPDFRRFEASGSCDIFTENRISGSGTVTIDLSGSCDVKMDINAPKIDAELSGAGDITLKGETRDFSVNGSGSTDVRCFELHAENVEVRISGSGDAEVFASVKLDVRVSGAGSVRYRGTPSVNQSISGAGSVKKVD